MKGTSETMFLVLSDTLTVNIDLIQSIEIRSTEFDPWECEQGAPSHELFLIFCDMKDLIGNDTKDMLIVFEGSRAACIDEKRRLEMIIRETGITVAYAHRPMKVANVVPHHMKNNCRCAKEITNDSVRYGGGHIGFEDVDDLTIRVGIRNEHLRILDDRDEWQDDCPTPFDNTWDVDPIDENDLPF